MADNYPPIDTYLLFGYNALIVAILVVAFLIAIVLGVRLVNSNIDLYIGVV